MKSLAVLLVLVAACSKKEATPAAGSGSGSAAAGSGSAVVVDTGSGSGSAAAPTGGDPRLAETMKEMGTFVEEVCACKDVACITGVQQKLQTWGMEQAKKKDFPQPGPDEMKQLETMGKRMEECAAKVAGGGSGAAPTPPAAPADAAKNAAIFAPRIAKMKDFTAKICACKDAACKTKLNDEMMKWGQETFKDTEGAVITPEIQKEMTAIAEEYGKCAQ